jgi:hypothetical protein
MRTSPCMGSSYRFEYMSANTDLQFRTGRRDLRCLQWQVMQADAVMIKSGVRCSVERPGRRCFATPNERGQAMCAWRTRGLDYYEECGTAEKPAAPPSRP